MIIVTGHSEKQDGICFLADTDDVATALQMAADAWNAQFRDKMKLVTIKDTYGTDSDYLVGADTTDKQVAELSRNLDGGAPGWGSYILYCGPIKPSTIAQHMPW